MRRAAAEKLELEADTHRLGAEEMVRDVERVLLLGQAECRAQTACIAVEVERAEMALGDAQNGLNFETEEVRRIADEKVAALEAVVAATKAQAAKDVDAAKAEFERQKHLLVGQTQDELERALTEITDLKRSHAADLAHVEATHTAALQALRQQQAEQCEQLNQQLRATRKLLSDEEAASSSLRRQLASVEAEHEQRHAKFALQCVEVENELKGEIAKLEKRNDELMTRIRAVTNDTEKESAELRGRLQSMRVVHAAALASNALQGDRMSAKGRQMIFYESLKSATRKASSMSWRGPEATPDGRDAPGAHGGVDPLSDEASAAAAAAEMAYRIIEASHADKLTPGAGPNEPQAASPKRPTHRQAPSRPRSARPGVSPRSPRVARAR